MSKTKLPAILINHDFYTKPRNLRFIKQNGFEAVSILLAVWIASSQERDFRISKEDAFVLPVFAHFPDEKIAAVLESAIEFGLLEEKEGYYFNSQIISDGCSYQRTKEKNAERQRQQRANKADTSDVCQTLVTRDGAETPVNGSGSVIVLGSDLETKNVSPAMARLEADAITREFAEKSLIDFGLKPSDLQRACLIIDRHYHNKPHLKPSKFDFTAPWLLKELTDLDTSKTRNQNSKKPGGFTPHTASNTFAKNQEYLKNRTQENNGSAISVNGSIDALFSGQKPNSFEGNRGNLVPVLSRR